jgi:GNAT superfamily N-acetyltransferase
MKTVINNDAFLRKGYTLSTDNSLLNFNVVYDFLTQESYWAKGISQEKLRKAIDNSVCFAIYHENNLCSFARVITDKATFAYICDVFVLKAYRRQGLSKWLIQNIRQHPELMVKTMVVSYSRCPQPLQAIWVYANKFTR